MTDDLAAQLRRERIVRENLAARLGSLMAENLELLARIYELENPEPDPAPLPNSTGTIREGEL